jgi:hypothetical protein
MRRQRRTPPRQSPEELEAAIAAELSRIEAEEKVQEARHEQSLLPELPTVILQGEVNEQVRKLISKVRAQWLSTFRLMSTLTPHGYHCSSMANVGSAIQDMYTEKSNGAEWVQVELFTNGDICLFAKGQKSYPTRSAEDMHNSYFDAYRRRTNYLFKILSLDNLEQVLLKNVDSFFCIRYKLYVFHTTCYIAEVS